MGRGHGGRPGVLLLPWWAARAIYGPYGAGELRERFRRGEFGAEADVPVTDKLAVRVLLDPLLRILIPARAWVGLGVVVLLVKTAADPDPRGRAQDVWLHGVVTMVLGPYGVLLGIAVLLVVAGEGRRRSALRSMRRPAAIAAVTVALSVGVFGLQLPVVREAVERALTGAAGSLGASWGLLGLVAGPWLFVFGSCSVYLMHRNGFSWHSHPYLRPIVASWLSCLVAAVELAAGDRAGLDRTGFLAATLAGPVVVVGLSVVEAARLRHLGVTVGGPATTPGAP